MVSPPKAILVPPNPPNQASALVKQLHPSTKQVDWLVFVGIDAETWGDSDRIQSWVVEFNKHLRQQEAELFPLTSVIILAWPTWLEKLPGSPDPDTRFNHLLLSGCKLRLKRPAFYRQGVPAKEADFEADLKDAGWWRVLEVASPPSPRLPPSFETEAEQDNYKQRLEFYGNPPFRWGAAEKKRVFPKSP
jgi:hypothetical protein